MERMAIRKILCASFSCHQTDHTERIRSLTAHQPL
jgi:hypothetical protein